MSESIETIQEFAKAISLLAIEQGVEDSALDDLVIDVCLRGKINAINDTENDEQADDEITQGEQKASEINNGGLVNQIRFLMQNGVTQDQIKEELES